MDEREKELKGLIDNIDDAKPELEGEDSNVKEAERQKAKGYYITNEMLEQEKERIGSLNFLAVLQYKKEIQQQISDLEDTKLMIETLQSLLLSNRDENLGLDIQMENIKDQIDMATQEEMDEFIKNYPNNIENLNKTIEFIEKREEELKDIPKTSTYMNTCMLEVLNQKLITINNLSGKRYKPIKHFYNNIKKIYENRDSMDFLLDQVKPNIVYVRRILNDLKKEKKNGKDGKNLTKAIMQNVQNTFCKVFKLEQMRLFELHLKSIFDGKIEDAELVSFLYQYLIYIIYTNEKQRKKGYHKWVEVLIMNVLDIESGNYDLPKEQSILEDQIFEMAKNMMREINPL